MKQKIHLEQPKKRTTIGEFILYCFLILGIITSVWIFVDNGFALPDGSSRPPDIPQRCELEIGANLTLEGSASSIEEKTSSSGNKYYLYDIDARNNCTYPAFGWDYPDTDGFYGYWARNQFGKYQFTVEELEMVIIEKYSCNKTNCHRAYYEVPKWKVNSMN